MNNKMATGHINRLIWQMGLPMILSMVLQAVYNVVDTVFVINSSAATQGNAALTAAFPIQLIIIAVGVGTGVGINSMLSRALGENDRKKASRIAGNGIFLAVVIYLIFFIFGIALAKPYMKLMSSETAVIKMGTEYLRICCCFSAGAIGFTVYERFLQATGKTVHSMLAQITGALSNIVLDYIFVLVMDWGVAGAAWATVIGQVLSLIIAMIFHYFSNREINGNIEYVKPSAKIIGAVYKIGIPAAIMQSLLALMMFSVLQVFRFIENKTAMTLMINAYGIYYKIMQTALFACFGLSNTLISIVAFNSGMGDKARLRAAIRYGLINSILVSGAITVIFQLLAVPVSELFGMSLPEISDDGIAKADILSVCQTAIHISSIGYIFMGINVAAQGIMQGLRKIYQPIIIAVMRLIVFVIPFAVYYCLCGNTETRFWQTFIFSELLTAIYSMTVVIKIYGQSEAAAQAQSPEEANIPHRNR